MGKSLEEERGRKACGAVAGNRSKNDMRIKGRGCEGRRLASLGGRKEAGTRQGVKEAGQGTRLGRPGFGRGTLGLGVRARV